jgi:hypothetical protein
MTIFIDHQILFFLQFIDSTKVGEYFLWKKSFQFFFLINYFLKISKIPYLTHRSYFEYLRFWQSQNIKFFFKKSYCNKIQFFWYNILHLKTDITNFYFILMSHDYFYVSSDSFSPPPPPNLLILQKWRKNKKVQIFFWIIFSSKISKIWYLTHRPQFEYLKFWQSQNIKFF